MLAREPLRIPRGLLALILGATVVPLLALLALGFTLLEQEKALEREQVRQRVERAADLVVAGLQRALAQTQQQLASGDDAGLEGAAWLTLGDGRPGLRAIGRMAYLPEVPPLPSPPPAALAEAERLEFRSGDPSAAIAAYRRLLRSPDPRLHGGGLLGLGRTLRKAGRTREALSAYARLSGIDGVAAGEVPVSLAALYATGEILEHEGRREELQAVGARLDDDLAAVRWRLSGPVYRLYARDARRWSGRPRDARPAETLAGAAERLGTGWAEAGVQATAAPEVIEVEGTPVTVAWSGSGVERQVLLALPEFVRARWLARVREVADAQQVEVGLRAGTQLLLLGGELGPGHRATRAASDTGLPWPVVVASRLPAREEAVFARRRGLMTAGVALVVGMGLVAGALVVRSVSSERRVARLQADFVAAVSHEFRTPLTTLRQFTERLIEKPELGAAERREAHEVQSRATARLTRLVESLLDLGRMEADARPYRFESVDGAELVGRAVEEFRDEVRSSGHAVSFAAEAPAPIEADPAALVQAVRNLLENAVKYSPEPRPVDVRVARVGSQVRIAVRDQGLGIPPAEQVTIFERFRRGEAAKGLGIRGLGVGLALVDGIVRAHGGRVLVESAPGRGSTFTIELPARG